MKALIFLVPGVGGLVAQAVAPATGGDFWTTVLGGAIGSSPVAVVLWIVLSREQKRNDQKDTEITRLNEEARTREFEREKEMRSRERDLIARLAPIVYESSRAYEEGMRSLDRDGLERRQLEDVMAQLKSIMDGFHGDK